MKGVLILIDGLGDRACKQLNGKTPLEAAEKPNLDWLSENSKLGFMYSVKEGIYPESDKAVVSILGNKNFPSRGQLEALGAGLNLVRGDLALRTNFGTIDNLKKKNVLDRRAGRNLTNKEAIILTEAINKNVKLPCKFIFKNTIQHRGILVLKGGFSDNITNTDPEYQRKKQLNYKLNFSEPLDEEENTKYTANIVNMFIEQSYKVLDEHHINMERRKKGLFPANILFTRDAGIELPKLERRDKWAVVCYMPLETGISKAMGMKVFSFPYPELKGYDVYKNLYEGLKKASKFAVKTLKKQRNNFNYFYIHFKETDVPGHDNMPLEKKKMIEMLDKNFFSFIVKLVKNKKIEVIITGDHSTPCELKMHSSDPLPLLFYGKGKDSLMFSETNAKKGSLGKIYGNELLRKVGFS